MAQLPLDLRAREHATNPARVLGRGLPVGQQVVAPETLPGRVRSRNCGAAGNAASTSCSKGAAVLAPKKPGLGVPSGRPTHTPTVCSSVTPTAHASRKPKLVPVFHASRRAPSVRWRTCRA